MRKRAAAAPVAAPLGIALAIWVFTMVAPVARAASAPLAVHVRAQSPSTYLIEVDLAPEAVPLVPTTVGGKTFTQVGLPTPIARGPAGAPELPVLHRLLAVQPGQRYEVHVALEGRSSVDHITLKPVQPDVPDVGGPRPMVVDAGAYQADRELGAETVTLGHPTRLGPVTLLPVNIMPVHYNPARHRLTMWRKVTAYVYADGATGELNPHRAALTHFQASQLTALADNAKAIRRAFPTASQSRILVLTSNDLLAKAQELAASGHYAGLTVDVQALPAGATAQNVKDLISAAYAKGDLNYVLFFGDETRIPVYTFPSSPSDVAVPGDSWYAMLNGDSFLSVGLGRLPVHNADEATTAIGKLAKYDQLQKSGYTNRTTLLVANKEGYPDKYTANQEAVRKAANPLGLKYVTEYGGAGASNQNLIDAINRGAALISYRGHGDYLTWAIWDTDGSSFGADQIKPLANYDQGLAVVFSLACDTGVLQSSLTSFAETLLLDNSAGGNANHGAVAVLASTEASYTDANDAFNTYLFNALENSKGIDLGTLYAQATNMMIRDTTGTVNTDALENVKMYILYGDPALKPWIN